MLLWVGKERTVEPFQRFFTAMGQLVAFGVLDFVNADGVDLAQHGTLLWLVSSTTLVFLGQLRGDRSRFQHRKRRRPQAEPSQPYRGLQDPCGVASSKKCKAL